MTLLQMIAGDLLPIVQATLQNSDGSIINLTGASATFQLIQNGETLLNSTASITDPAHGVVQYSWVPGDTEKLGLCQASFIVVFADGSIQTFPLSGDFFILFLGMTSSQATARKGYISTPDAEATLNMAYDAASGNYTVYGLTMTPHSVQAAVDFANRYVQNMTDSSWPNMKSNTAWMAALDIACIRILVVSMGGSLVGAFDYFLGDLRVARTGPYKEAITATLQGFRDDLSRQFVNLSTPAIAAEANMKDDIPTYQGSLMNP